MRHEKSCGAVIFRRINGPWPVLLIQHEKGNHIAFPKGHVEQGETEAQTYQMLPDGMYEADFGTDGSMFHVNETKNGKGILTVNGGEMSIHIVMPSKNIVNLFCGSAEDAQKEGAALIEPLTEEVTYEDGTTEEVNSFDLPVP